MSSYAVLADDSTIAAQGMNSTGSTYGSAINIESRLPRQLKEL